MIINPECNRNCLSARLRLDPLGKLTVLPKLPSWIGEGPERGVQGERKAKGDGGREEGICRERVAV